MGKEFRRDYLDMNHTILELLLNLSGNYLQNGKITLESVLFRRKAKQSDIDLHWQFYRQKDKKSIFSSDEESNQSNDYNNNKPQPKTEEKQIERNVFTLGKYL